MPAAGTTHKGLWFMETLLMKLADFGAVGIIAALAIWQVFYLSRRMMGIIENNTKAMTELKDAVRGCIHNR
jgi:hypothetical protein